jgi:hypothetical protein
LFPNFPRKRSQKFTQYITEQPEVSSQSRELEEGQNKKNQNQPKEQKMKLKTQIVAIALGLAVGTSLVWSADGPPRETTPTIGVDADWAMNRHQHPTIEGVWQVARTGVNCDDPNQVLVGPFPAIMTFHRDGTMTADTGALEGFTSEYGSWQREPGSQNYSFRDTSLETDENGALAIVGIVTANVHLTDTSSFTYSATIQLFDADGNLIATFCGRTTGTRFE